MFKFVFVLIFVTQIMIQDSMSRNIPESIETMDTEEITEKSSSTNNINDALKPTEDAIINFVQKLLTTGYVTSRVALSRLEQATDKKKEIGDQLEGILEMLPSFPKKVPFLDDIPHF